MTTGKTNDEPERRHRSGNTLLDPNGRYRTPPGYEPMTALSARGLRTLLGAIFTPLFLAGTVALSFAAWLSPPPPAKPSREDYIFIAAACFFAAVVACADLIVNESRRRRERRHRR